MADRDPTPEQLARPPFLIAPLANPIMVRKIMSMGGVRVVYRMQPYISAVSGFTAFADMSCQHIATAAYFCCSEGATNRDEREIQTVVQAMAAGFSDADCDTWDLTKMVMARALKEGKSNFPADSMPQLLQIAAWLADDTPITAAEVTARRIYDILEVLSASPEQTINTMRVFAHGVLAYCKMGNVTPHVINKMTAAIREEFSLNVSLNASIIRGIWTIIAPVMDNVKIRIFLKLWENAIAGSSMRFRLIVQQASWAGMTNFCNIARAKSTFPDFYWSSLASIIPGEFDAYMTAAALVDNDEFYGYKPDLGLVRSTLYPNLSYCAKSLLQNVGGQISLNAFQGVSNTVSHISAIEQMITKYREARSEAVTKAVRDPSASGKEKGSAFLKLDLHVPLN